MNEQQPTAAQQLNEMVNERVALHLGRQTLDLIAAQAQAELYARASGEKDHQLHQLGDRLSSLEAAIEAASAAGAKPPRASRVRSRKR